MNTKIPLDSKYSYLLPWVTLDLRELELCVIRIHLPDLVPGRSTEHLDDLHQLIHTAVSWEDGLTQQ